MRSTTLCLTVLEWIVYLGSVLGILLSFFLTHNTEIHYLIGSLLGVTALIFISKGNPIGQAICIGFAIFYAVISYSYRYWGEMITYLGISLPTGVWSLICWLKHPSNGKRSEVCVHRISGKEWAFFVLLIAAVTVVFYFILRALDTANLAFSTLSVATSFAAGYLTARRTRFYAIAYALNDVVLIVLWAMATVENFDYLPMIICFCAFFLLDGYGFINWTRMERKQKRQTQSN